MPKTKKLPTKITRQLIVGIAVFVIGMVALAGVIYSARTGNTFMGTKAANDCAECKKACKEAFPQERGREHQTQNYDNCIKTCKKGVCKYDPEASPTPSPVGIVTPAPSIYPRDIRNTNYPSSKQKSSFNSGNTLQPTPWITNNGNPPSGN